MAKSTSLIRIAGALVASVVLAAVALVGAAPPAAAQAPPQTGGLAVGPAQTAGGVKRSSFDFVVAAGGVQDDSVVVSNLSDQKKSYFVYVANGFTTDTGKIAVRPNEAPKTGVATWLKFGPDLPDGQIILEPKTAAVIPFRINVPIDASPGDYAFGIAAVPPALRPVPVQGENRTTVVDAVAVAVQLRVQGPLRPSVRITKLTVESTPPLIPFLIRGETDVRIEITNDGNQRLPATVHIREENLFGRTIHTDPDRLLPSLLPGDTVTVRARWHKAPLVKGSIVVDVTTEGAGGAGATRSREFWSIPWKLIIAIIVLVLGYLWWRRRRRRREEEPVAEPEAPSRDPVAVGSA
jgi:hypothetical protein